MLFVSVCLCGICSTSTIALSFAFHLRFGWWWVLAWVAGWLVVGAATSHTVTQPFVRRLYGLEEAAVLIAAGRLGHRIEDAGQTDEVARIAQQFNVMATKIEEQVKTLRKLAEENRALAGEAEEVAVGHERQRLARELHDSVSQELFALSMLAASAQQLHEQRAESLAETLGQISEIATAAQREMRALLLHLRPAALEGRSFVDAALAFLDAVEERHAIRCTLDVRSSMPLEPAVEEQLFRILQEATANVLKHAEAKEVRVVWETDGAVGKLTILDNGKGIRAVDGAADSLGMKAMKERAVELGGRCDVWRRPQGTAVEVQIPILNGQGRELS